MLTFLGMLAFIILCLALAIVAIGLAVLPLAGVPKAAGYIVALLGIIALVLELVSVVTGK